MGVEVFSLKGKIALVTGGGTGIGLGITQAMSEAGAKIIITGRREGILKDARERIGNSVSYFVHDVQDKSSIPALLENIESSIGPIDILVNNAGVQS